MKSSEKAKVLVEFHLSFGLKGLGVSVRRNMAQRKHSAIDCYFCVLRSRTKLGIIHFAQLSNCTQRESGSAEVSASSCNVNLGLSRGVGARITLKMLIPIEATPVIIRTTIYHVYHVHAVPKT